MEKRQFLVRLNCEYSISVEANDEKHALEQAMCNLDDRGTPCGWGWKEAWSELEAEEDM